MKKTYTLLLSLLLALSVLFSVPVSAQTLGLLPDTVRRPAAGVTETEYSTQTEDGKPVRYFVLDTAYGLPGSHLKIGVGLPNNGTSFGMQKLTEQLAAIRAGGTNVLAGVNGDFYNMVTGEPEGLFVKDGVPLHGWSAPNALPDSLGRIPYRTFFGIKSDGRAVIGGRTVYDSVKGCLQQAIGGAFMLVENGQPVKVRYPASVRSFVENRHPRTAVGIRRNGTVFFICVDGRRENYSNGISLYDLADLMRKFGAWTAMDLDGGGSTALCTLDRETGTLPLRNSPSGQKLGSATGGERKIANCVYVYE